MYTRQTFGNFEPAALGDVASIARRSSLWGKATACGRQVEILGFTFDNVSLGEATAELVAAALGGQRRRVVFVNAHVVNCAHADAAYRRTVETAECRYADGSGLAIAARMAGRALADNVNGTDMLPMLAAEAQRKGATIFLLGGAPGRADATATALAEHGAEQAIAGTHHGFLPAGSADEQAAIDAINASGAAIVLVGMGVPMQDQWIERNAHRLTAPVLIGVGGLFDFYSGSVTRAPVLLRTFGLEWTWRLAQEPGRMWRRYVIGNATFLTRAAYAGTRSRLSSGNT